MKKSIYIVFGFLLLATYSCKKEEIRPFATTEFEEIYIQRSGDTPTPQACGTSDEGSPFKSTNVGTDITNPNRDEDESKNNNKVRQKK